MARTRRDAVGSAIGMLVFLGGIALLGLTFKLAYNMFVVPPDQALKLSQQKTIDLAATGGSFVMILIRALLLLVMGIVSSLIANRGIHLYSHSLIQLHEADSIAIVSTERSKDRAKGRKDQPTEQPNDPPT